MSCGCEENGRRTNGGGAPGDGRRGVVMEGVRDGDGEGRKKRYEVRMKGQKQQQRKAKKKNKNTIK